VIDRRLPLAERDAIAPGILAETPLISVDGGVPGPTTFRREDGGHITTADLGAIIHALRGEPTCPGHSATSDRRDTRRRTPRSTVHA
jgi:hypothetical protein